MRILAGTDLRPVALPNVPEGYRWVIKPYVRYGPNYLRVVLEEEVEFTHGWFVKKQEMRWEQVSYRNVDGEYAKSGTTVVDLVEEAAKGIVKTHLKKLEDAIAREALVGIYEQGTKQALP